jgi:hypothetical protein
MAGGRYSTVDIGPVGLRPPDAQKALFFAEDHSFFLPMSGLVANTVMRNYYFVSIDGSG